MQTYPANIGMDFCDHEDQAVLARGPIVGVNGQDAVVDAISRSTALVEFSLNGTILSANANFCRIMGYRDNELEGLHHRVLVSPEDADAPEYALLWERLRSGEFINAVFKRIARDGREVWLQVTYNPILNQSGQPRSILKMATNVTLERQRASGYQNIYNALSRSTALLEMDLDGNIITANDSFLGLLGYSTFDVLGRHHRMFVDPAEAAAPGYEAFWKRLRGGEYIRSEFRRIRSDGREIWLLASYNPVTDASNRPYKILKIATDITAAVQQRTQAALLATTDGLTGLANRRAFDDTLKREFRRAERTGMPLSLVMVDVDNFKAYNDYYGHQAGDECLVVVARTIGRLARRAGDTAARYGGEEFAVILPNTDLAGAVEFAEILRNAIEVAGLVHKDNAPSGYLTISAGVASSTMAASVPERAAMELLAAADQALFAAKHAGRNRVLCLDSSALPPDTAADATEQMPFSAVHASNLTLAISG